MKRTGGRSEETRCGVGWIDGRGEGTRAVEDHEHEVVDCER